MLTLCVALQAAIVHASASRRAGRSDGGQATAEYALVLLGAATIALVLAAWAMKTGKITALFDAVIDKIASNL